MLFISKIHLNVGLKKCFPYLPTRLWVWERERERERERVMWACFEKEELPQAYKMSLSLLEERIEEIHWMNPSIYMGPRMRLVWPQRTSKRLGVRGKTMRIAFLLLFHVLWTSNTLPKFPIKFCHLGLSGINKWTNIYTYITRELMIFVAWGA